MARALNDVIILTLSLVQRSVVLIAAAVDFCDVVVVIVAGCGLGVTAEETTVGFLYCCYPYRRPLDCYCCSSSSSPSSHRETKASWLLVFSAFSVVMDT